MAFEGTSLAESSAVLKEYYTGVRLKNLMLKGNPFMGMVRRNPNVSGKLVQPVVLSGSKGISSKFGRAQANQSAAITKEFMPPVADDFGVVTVDWKAAEATRNDDGAFENTLKLHTDTTLQEVANTMAAKLFRRGYGTIGVISTIDSATGIIVLKNPGDAQFFAEDVILNASATEGGAPIGGAATPTRARVKSADWVGGTVTLDTEGGAAAWIGTYLANQFLQLDGTYGAPQIVGVRGWIPDKANQPVAGENFMGIDRSVAPTQLAGVGYDGTGATPQEAVISACSLMSKFKSQPGVLYVGPDVFAAFAKTVQSDRQYIEISGAAGIGVKAIEILAEYGPVAVVSDRNVEPNFGHLLSMETWELQSYGEAPKFTEYEDGLIYYRRPDANAVEGRIVAFSQLVCTAPIKNCTITFAPLGG
jgi:hypothetical protein